MDRPIFCDDMDEEDPYFYVLVAVVASIVIAVCVCVGFCSAVTLIRYFLTTYR